MKEEPKAREEDIISRDMWSSILLNGVFIAGMCVFFLKSSWIQSFFSSKEAFMAGFFAFFVFINTFNQFNCRVPQLNLFGHILQNKGFLRVITLILGVQIILTHAGGIIGDIFRTVPLMPKEWLGIALLALTIIPFDLMRKMMRGGASVA
jgi:magnesium-transporting ATPase (P-type)